MWLNPLLDDSTGSRGRPDESFSLRVTEGIRTPDIQDHNLAL